MNVDFNQIIQRFEKGEALFLADKVRIRIPNAEQRLRGGLDYFVKRYTFGKESHAKWMEKNYRPIVDWMSDNEGRGLLITGGCGLGKTLIAKHILPLLLQDSCRKLVNIFTAQELNTKIDEILNFTSSVLMMLVQKSLRRFLAMLDAHSLSYVMQQSKRESFSSLPQT